MQPALLKEITAFLNARAAPAVWEGASFTIGKVSVMYASNVENKVTTERALFGLIALPPQYALILEFQYAGTPLIATDILARSELSDDIALTLTQELAAVRENPKAPVVVRTKLPVFK